MSAGEAKTIRRARLESKGGSKRGYAEQAMDAWLGISFANGNHERCCGSGRDGVSSNTNGALVFRPCKWIPLTMDFTPFAGVRRPLAGSIWVSKEASGSRRVSASGHPP
jgi:hypothetical protein